MMKRWSLLLALALVAAPAAANAQQGSDDGRPDGPRAGAPGAPVAPSRALVANPLRFLVAHSADLKLDAGQLDRIRERSQQLQAANRPLLEKLQAARGQRAGRGAARPDRAAMRERMEQLRPTMEQIRKNGAAAWQDALGYLTEEQVKQVQVLRQERMRMRMRRHSPAGARAHAQRPASISEVVTNGRVA